MKLLKREKQLTATLSAMRGSPSETFEHISALYICIGCCQIVSVLSSEMRSKA